MGRSLPIITPWPESFEEIVARYITDKRRLAIAERESVGREPTFKAAVRRAGLALTDDGKRHSHQSHFRVRQATLDAWAPRLLAHLDLLAPAGTFEELQDRVDSLRFKFVGPLITYDTAYRIGAKLGLEPRLVYLHCGTRKGALLLGLGKGRPHLERDELPPAFRALRPYEIEDCLSTYEDDIARIVGA
jgi:hypothetical protein